MARVRFFGGASDVAQGQKEMKVISKTLRETFEYLKEILGDQFTAFVFDETGSIRPFVNIFVNKKHVRQLQGLDTKISDEDEILIVPAIAGG